MCKATQLKTIRALYCLLLFQLRISVHVYILNHYFQNLFKISILTYITYIGNYTLYNNYILHQDIFKYCLKYCLLLLPIIKMVDSMVYIFISNYLVKIKIIKYLQPNNVLKEGVQKFGILIYRELEKQKTNKT